jgi:hypothetical protein
MPITPRMLRTVGEMVFPTPEPLPDTFLGRCAASVAAEPERWGRVFLHALKAAREGQQHGG